MFRIWYRSEVKRVIVLLILEGNTSVVCATEIIFIGVQAADASVLIHFTSAKSKAFMKLVVMFTVKFR